MSNTTTVAEQIPETAVAHPHTIALSGNPNSGKSTLFNLLTGLNQKVGNYPGVTVERKTGKFQLAPQQHLNVIDLPGTYSLYPRSADEQVVSDTLLNTAAQDYPDVLVAVADMSKLERSLLLVSQLIDLGLPTLVVLNMSDMAERQGITVNVAALSKALGGVPVVVMNARTGEGLEAFKEALQQPIPPANKVQFDALALSPEVISEAKQLFKTKNYYQAYLLLQQSEKLPSLSEEDKTLLERLKAYSGNFNEWQVSETQQRYARINDIVKLAVRQQEEKAQDHFSARIDKMVTHPVWGYVIFFGLLFVIFQAIFAWASVPMDMIDTLFADVSGWLGERLPEGALSSLLVDGILPGIGGIIIFVPQIVILFTLIAILEESGYMARVVFLMDRLMRKVGLNGRSVVPLISGLACAVPAIMATRGIDDWKDRLITIFVTPFMSCSARLPVYTILIALVVPNTNLAGFINLQGLVLMGMYLLGFVAAIGSAMLMKLLIRAKTSGFLLMELPAYRMPRWGNVGIMTLEKAKTFVFEAGKIILAVSVILWVLASYGPGSQMEQAAEQYQLSHANSENLDDELAAVRLENSYAGHIGRFIEPAIRPLGYDWRIGIALVSSFAAREVFVGTMATLYSVGSADDEATVRSRMQEARNPDTGERQFTLAVAVSLLIFYAFAMQCTSTLAIVYRETNGWKWPLLQMLYMTGLAYISALIAYQILR